MESNLIGPTSEEDFTFYQISLQIDHRHTYDRILATYNIPVRGNITLMGSADWINHCMNWAIIRDRADILSIYPSMSSNLHYGQVLAAFWGSGRCLNEILTKQAPHPLALVFVVLKYLKLKESKLIEVTELQEIFKLDLSKLKIPNLGDEILDEIVTDPEVKELCGRKYAEKFYGSVQKILATFDQITDIRGATLRFYTQRLNADDLDHKIIKFFHLLEEDPNAACDFVDLGEDLFLA